MWSKVEINLSSHYMYLCFHLVPSFLFSVSLLFPCFFIFCILCICTRACLCVCVYVPASGYVFICSNNHHLNLDIICFDMVLYQPLQQTDKSTCIHKFPDQWPWTKNCLHQRAWVSLQALPVILPGKSWERKCETLVTTLLSSLQKKV